MDEKQKLNLFVSYSHEDEIIVKEFLKHTKQLKHNGIIQEWYDRKIIAGEDYQNTIDNNLIKADIICLMISANFLASSACIKEKENAIRFRKSKGTVVVPIILSACAWLDDKMISKLLALPTDGQPILSYTEINSALFNVYEGLKKVCEKIKKIREIKVNDSFLKFLENTELLTKAHSQKENIFLDDIFIYPELIRYDELRKKNISESAEKVLEFREERSKILIAGEGQSGKTTLCKKLFIELIKKDYIPVYISIVTSTYNEKIILKIKRAIEEQYQNVTIADIDTCLLVPIIDDYHFAKNKENIIDELSVYKHHVLIVDDIFNMNFIYEKISKTHSFYKIKEFSPLLRHELIKKWTNLTDMKYEESSSINQIYQRIDQNTELVDVTLGKILGSGIMPAYPFFILSIISTYNTFDKPLDQEITSQGYCYQALIYLYLRKQGVKNDEVDTYINFLTEFAYYLFSINKTELSFNDFKKFMDTYHSKYNLPVKEEELLKKLKASQLISLSSCNNYSFVYPYIYYYFVAKYIAEHIEVNKEIKRQVDRIINNLHKNENAYIAIFISHHSKNIYLLEEIVCNAFYLFEKFKPATLSTSELSFFDEQSDLIVKEVLPNDQNMPENARRERLQIKGVLEEEIEKDKIYDTDEEGNELLIELRRSIKTVEVMGIIVKNRAGSLEKELLSMVVEEAMNVHLRALTSFFEIIKDKKGQENIIKFISGRLNKIIDEMDKTPNQEGLEKISKLIFWNTNFSVVLGYIDKIIHSVGSDKLIKIISDICDKTNTPASFLIKHGIYMWYNKCIEIEDISKKLKESNFAEISKKIIKYIIIQYSAMHNIDYRDKQKIELKLLIPLKTLEIQSSKINK